MIASTKGRHPLRTICRMSVEGPTPANVNRNAHFDTLATFASCPLLSNPAVATADTARKPSTNLGQCDAWDVVDYAGTDEGIAGENVVVDLVALCAQPAHPITAGSSAGRLPLPER
jgi:hypothetical protein